MVHLHRLLAALALVAAGAVQTAAAEPQWIWATAKANAEAPPGTCAFSREFMLGEPDSGRIDIVCDNRYVLRVNGRLVGASNNWQQMDRYDVTTLLAAGRNTIEVRCINDEGPAGLAMRVVVKAQGADKVDLSTDGKWQSRIDTGASWNPAVRDQAKAAPAVVLGPLGKTAPWNDAYRVASKIKATKAAAPSADEPFALVDGDVVVLLGNTFVERSQRYGYIETALSARYPGCHVVFRNLGWSGDTVWGEARARFGKAADGFRHLAEHVFACKPTVIFVCYGTNESFAGEGGLDAFAEGLQTLLDTLEQSGARLVLVSPLKQENLGPPLPDPALQNQNLLLYSQMIEETARQRGHRFVDLYGLQPSSDAAASERLTDNGIHLTAYGYWRIAERLQERLGLPPAMWRVELNADSGKQQATGVVLREVELAPGGVRFQALDAQLPQPPAPSAAAARPAGSRILRVTGLQPATYRLTIDGRAVATDTHKNWAAGVALADGPEVDQAEKLRQAICRKNELYFYRWRPQNETYLYLFRKHEQGQNAREIPQFDPLVEEQEQEIARLRAPLAHRYELLPIKEK